MLGGDPIRGHVETMILGALRDGPTHGYGLIVRLRELSDGAFDLKEGTVYPALHRLERDGKLLPTDKLAAACVGPDESVFRAAVGGSVARAAA